MVAMLALLFSVMAIVILPEARQEVLDWAPGVSLPGFMFFYTPNTLYAAFEMLDAPGREAYLFMLLTAGVFFLILSCVFFISLTLFLYKDRRFQQKVVLLRLPFRLLYAGILEFILLLILIVVYPEQYYLLVRMASFFSVLKYLLVAVILMGVAVGAWLWCLRLLKSIEMEEGA